MNPLVRGFRAAATTVKPLSTAIHFERNETLGCLSSPSSYRDIAISLARIAPERTKGLNFRGLRRKINAAANRNARAVVCRVHVVEFAESELQYLETSRQA